MSLVGESVMQLGRDLFQPLSPGDQLLASGLVVVTAALLGVLLFPLLLRKLRYVVTERYLGDDVASFAAAVADRFPLTTPVRFLLRVFQVFVSASALLALLLIWEQVGLLNAIVDLLSTPFGEDGQIGVEHLLNALVSLVLAVAAYIGMGLVQDAVTSFRRETDRLTAHQEQIVTRVAQLALLTFVGLVILGVWGVNLSGLLVGAGFLGIVFGLAARQTIGSLIAGFVLMLSRPFEIGDWVIIGDQEGVVTEITIISTRLENFDGEFVVIPNDKVADRAITNRSQKGRLRLRVDVGVDYDADPERAAEVAEEAIGTVEAVEETPPPHVFPKSFGDSAVVLEMRFWIDTPTPPKRWRAQSAVVNAVKSAFDDADIEIPYPQRELSGRAQTGGVHVRDGDPSAGESRPVPDGDSVTDETD